MQVCRHDEQKQLQKTLTWLSKQYEQRITHDDGDIPYIFHLTLNLLFYVIEACYI